jgi:hypothetical protein
MDKPDELTFPRATNERRVWLRVGTLLDGVSMQPLRSAHVAYDKNRILLPAKTHRRRNW